MLICHCRALNDEAIRTAIVAQGAADPERLAAACGAGARCGGCRPALLALLDEVAGAPRAAHSSAA